MACGNGPISANSLRLSGARTKQTNCFSANIATFLVKRNVRCFSGHNRAKLRLINGEQFVELIFEHYAQLAPRYRSMIPLKQIFVPDLPQD